MCTLKATIGLHHPLALGEEGTDSPTSLTELREERKWRFFEKTGHKLECQEQILAIAS